MSKITHIIIHASASEWGTVTVIDSWHRERGFSKVGYHFVILNGFANYKDKIADRQWSMFDGAIEHGRSLDYDEDLTGEEIGAHAKALGMNRRSIGICLIHAKGYKYTLRQLKSLYGLVCALQTRYNIPTENILGHYEVEPDKPDCPGLNMPMFRQAIETNDMSTLSYL